MVIVTYKFIHNHSNFFYGSFELLKVYFAQVHYIKVFELLVEEDLLINVLIVLLVYFIS